VDGGAWCQWRRTRRGGGASLRGGGGAKSFGVEVPFYRGSGEGSGGGENAVEGPELLRQWCMAI
jgi:hypothetical protein